MSATTTPERRRTWALFLAGPILWFGHFMAVYLLVESACAAGGTAAELLGLDVVALVTVVATAGAFALAVGVAVLSLREWRRRPGDVLAGGERASGVALGAMLLAILFAIAILFTGYPALVLEPC